MFNLQLFCCHSAFTHTCLWSASSINWYGPRTVALWSWEGNRNPSESNGSLLLGLWITSPAGCLPWKPEISTGLNGPWDCGCTFSFLWTRLSLKSEPFGLLKQVSTGRMSFLLPSQQHENTEDKNLLPATFWFCILTEPVSFWFLSPLWHMDAPIWVSPFGCRYPSWEPAEKIGLHVVVLSKLCWTDCRPAVRSV